MCEWKSKYDQDYKCPEGPLPPYPPGHCILHSREKKDLEAFKQKVNERMNAPDRIDLKGCYFPKDFPAEYFKNHPFDKPVDFSEATFSQDANFSAATFSQGAYFLMATLSQAADFSKAIFSQEADFSGAKFEKKVEFSDATFSKAYFFKARFSDADFSRATFSQWAGFAKTTFSQKANFRWVKFEKGANFNKTKFRESVFHHARFEGETIRFQKVDLSQCSFLDSIIDKVDFRYCKFVEEKGRKNVLKDERDCDEKVKGIDKGPFPYNGRVLIDTKEEEEARKGYEPVHRLYLELKKNFEEKKDWNTAGDFHFGEMESRRKMKEGWLGRNIFSLEALYYWASGYGERPWRAAFWLSALLFGCALGFIWAEQVSTTLGQSASGTSWGDAFFNFWDKFWYSIKVSTLLAHKAEVMEPLSRMGKVIFALESISGPLLIALLILALRRRVKR